MNDERVVEDIVTNFLLNTCLKRPQLSLTAVEAAIECVEAVTESTTPSGDEADWIPLTTGSVAEFYIEPMLPHIGDVDIMFYRSTQLAIPQGLPPPTQLTHEFGSFDVKVFEIVDSHLPCYVYLKTRYTLTQDFDELKYNAVEHPMESYLSNLLYDDNIRSSFVVHGPAIVYKTSDRLLPYESVRCVRCLVWPPQAANWSTRHRNDWPDSATVDRVLSNGCDVVGVAHRECRQHGWMGRLQWRLSFSRAEIVLINSWMPVQQIVYHMLRVFVKTERLTKSADNSEAGTLSNYHIKTLMLWDCELKPTICWTDDLSLVRICVELLHELAVWLTEAQCPHYFINNCNLLDNTFNLETISRQLLSISKSWFSSWFVNNYIRRCSQLCPHNVSRLFDDVSTSMKLQNAVLAIIDWRQNTNTQTDMWAAFDYPQCHIVSNISQSSLSVLSLLYLLTELRKINTSLPVYFLSVAFLHVALKTSRCGLNDELMDVLSVLVGQSIGPRRHSSRRSSVLLLRKGVNLMKDDWPKSRSILQLVAFEVSKAYLYRALSSEDCHSDSIYCLANVYLAVLYYTTRQYQIAIDHCTLVMRSQDHSQCSSHVVHGEILPKSDDDIDIVLGVAVFYQHVRMAALNQQQQSQYVTVFTTELFAHYLHSKCLSVTKYQQLSDTSNSQSSTDEVQSYVKYITDMQQLFIADVLLWKLVNAFYGQKFVNTQQFCRHQYTVKCPSELNTSHLVKLMHKTAMKYMTTFRQLKAREFRSVVTIVTTDFEALYAYKRGDYQQCLQLSTQNVHTLLYDERTESGIWMFPEFLQLLDDDIVSLTALTLIVDPKSRFRSCYFEVTQVTLILYLMTQCQLKLRHSVTSLAQSLHCIKVAHRRHPVENTIDRLILRMIAHKAVTYIRATIIEYTNNSSESLM